MGLISSLITGAFNQGSQASANAANIRLQELANENNIQLQREANQANLDLANLQYQNDVNMWNLQNAYNSPSAQMQRYKEAGLNPYLIYGSGSASAGNASSAPSYNSGTARQSAAQVHAAKVQAAHYQNMDILGSVLPILNYFQDVRMKDAQIERMKNQNLLLFLQGKNIESQIGFRGTQNDYTILQKENYLRKLDAQIASLKAGTRLRKIETKRKRYLFDNYTSKDLLTPAEVSSGSWQSQVAKYIYNAVQGVKDLFDFDFMPFHWSNKL